jgi:hypothetical protein
VRARRRVRAPPCTHQQALAEVKRRAEASRGQETLRRCRQHSASEKGDSAPAARASASSAGIAGGGGSGGTAASGRTRRGDYVAVREVPHAGADAAAATTPATPTYCYSSAAVERGGLVAEEQAAGFGRLIGRTRLEGLVVRLEQRDEQRRDLAALQLGDAEAALELRLSRISSKRAKSAASSQQRAGCAKSPASPPGTPGASPKSAPATRARPRGCSSARTSAASGAPAGERACASSRRALCAPTAEEGSAAAEAKALARPVSASASSSRAPGAEAAISAARKGAHA